MRAVTRSPAAERSTGNERDSPSGPRNSISVSPGPDSRSATSRLIRVGSPSAPTSIPGDVGGWSSKRRWTASERSSELLRPRSSLR